MGAGDGSTIDEEGFIWNARWGGGCLVRWAPDGSIDRTVEIPSQLVTSAIFGGEDLDVLYVTTARYMVSEQELAGAAAVRRHLRPGSGSEGNPRGSLCG